MAKVLVSMPSGWGNRILVDVKDYATLVDIFARSTHLSSEYCPPEKEHLFVETNFDLVCCTKVEYEVVTKDEFEVRRNAEPKPEPVEEEA